MAILDINFFPREQVKWYFNKRVYEGVTAFIISVLILVYFGVVKPLKTRNSKTSILAGLQSQVKEYNAIIEKENNINKAIEAYNERIQNVRTINSGSPGNWLYIVKSIKESAIDSVCITGYLYDNGKITVSGICKNDILVAEFIRRLEQKDFYKEISAEKVSYTDEYITFLVTGSLDWEAVKE